MLMILAHNTGKVHYEVCFSIKPSDLPSKCVGATDCLVLEGISYSSMRFSRSVSLVFEGDWIGYLGLSEIDRHIFSRKYSLQKACQATTTGLVHCTSVDCTFGFATTRTDVLQCQSLLFSGRVVKLFHC